MIFISKCLITILIYCNFSLNALGLSVGNCKFHTYNEPKRFNGKRGNNVINVVKHKIKDAVGEFKQRPASYTITTTSLCLSGLLWTGYLNKTLLLDKGTGIVPGLSKVLLNGLIIPRFKGSAIIDLIALFLTLKSLEDRRGWQYVSKCLCLNAVLAAIISNSLGQDLNFNILSRSITILSALETPDDTILLYGIVQVKHSHLPIYLLITDYILTSSVSAVHQGLIGAASGFLTSKLSNYMIK